MARTHTLTVLEQTPVSPPPDETAGISLPFTFLDLFWLQMEASVHRLIFYQHPISRTHFIDTLIPKLKNSLSHSLQHYTPLAGRMIVPPDNSILPEIRYKDGDTVPLVIAECNSGEGHFSHLTSDYSRSCSDFHPLVPSLPPTSRVSDGSIIVPVFALQVTLFPDVGICIGVTNHHAVGDGRSIFAFMKAWAFFSSHCHGDENSPPVSLPAELRPFYDRTVIEDRKGLRALLSDNVKHVRIEDMHVHHLPLVTDKVRAHVVLTRDNIQRLKSHVLARRPKLGHVSSFTVTCSYVWICIVKSRYEVNKDNYDVDEDEIFGCPADCRARLDPPVPENYFGNCLTTCIGFAKTKQLIGAEGLAEAADVIGESIRRVWNDKEAGLFKGIEDVFNLSSTLNFDRTMTVAGSPKFDYYEVDLGWGTPIKFEMPSIDLTGAISLCKAKDQEGGLEVGLSLPVAQMHTFTTIFTEGLKGFLIL